jgi:L-alanine-DL-glutamate epimerase-like enolase superfamily enzyme
VEVSVVVSEYPRTVGKNARLGIHGDGPTSPIAIARTDQGAAGWGLLRGKQHAFDDIIGRTLTDLFDPDVGVTARDAKPLDFALHDLAGVVRDQPIYQMLGVAGEDTVALYDGSIYMDDLDPDSSPRGIDVVLSNCADDYDLGHRAFKLKIGRGHMWMSPTEGLQRDIDVTLAVHDSFPDCRLLVDANNGYAPADFIDYLNGVRECELYWIEEPFHETREDLSMLRDHLRNNRPQTLIADGEADPEVPFLLDLANEQLLDVLIMDIVSFGFTPWRQLMPRLREIGVAASPHTWGVPVNSLYTAQLAAGVGNIEIVEGVFGATVGVDSSGYRLEEGKLHLPDLPGFGLSLPDVE